MRWAASAAASADLVPLADRVLGDVVRGLGGERPDLAFVFFGPDHAPRVAALRERVRAALGPVPVVGASALGVVGGGREHEGRTGLSVTAARLPDVAVRLFHVTEDRLPSPDAPPSAWHAALDVPATPTPGFVLVADPYSVRADTLVGGLDFAWPGARKVGGLASGAAGPGDTVLLVGDRVVSGGAVGVALAGDVVLAPAVAQGCRPFGPTMTITACREHLLLTLDGQPALDAVQRVLREGTERDRALARSSALFLGVETDPFAVPTDDGGPWLVRNFLGRERDGGGLFVGERLRVGRRVRMHLRDRATSAEDLEKTLDACASTLPAPCAGALVFSCLGRGMHLYGVPDHDARAFHARFPGVPLGGFFCSGEIGPVGSSTHLHGFTSSFGLFLPKTTRDA